MKISVIRLKPYEAHSKEERADRRRAAYSFLLSELRSEYGDRLSDSFLMEEDGHCDPVIAPLRKDALGKPYLPGHPEVLFNLSHSRNGYAAVIVADNREADKVGIDIEARFPYHELLARKICHEHETAALIQAVSDEERKNLLNRFWSRKEAVLKCEGTGIRSSLRELDTMNINPDLYEIKEEQTDDYTLVIAIKRVK